jgi:tRNA pseudouridine65 synthase
MDRRLPVTLPILYQDDHLIAVSKPSGMLVHRSWIDKEAKLYALQTVRNMTNRFVYPLHRLDKPTSGVLLFAFGKESARRFGEMFREQGMEKDYLAVVRGFTDVRGTIDYPLKKIKEGRREQAKEGDSFQEASTAYERLARAELPVRVGRYPFARYSLVRLTPKTGRKHQLRRHMKHIFHPIVGDTKYGRTEHNRLFRRLFESHRLLLHCERMAFEHPFENRRCEITAPLEGVMAEVVELLFGTIPPKKGPDACDFI